MATQIYLPAQSSNSSHVAVFGDADEQYGEDNMACIQLYRYLQLTEGQTRVFCESRTARYKIPHYTWFVDEFPMTVTGKLHTAPLIIAIAAAHVKRNNIDMKLQQLSKLLGYAGLIPFIVFSMSTWVTLPLVGNPHFVLMTYAAIILSFMGAIHWGLAMSRSSDIQLVELGLSVIPALIGWLALLITAVYGYVLLILSFIVLFIADKFASKAGLLPDWYLSMRAVLTTIVTLSMAAAMLAAI